MLIDVLIDTASAPSNVLYSMEQRTVLVTPVLAAATAAATHRAEKLHNHSANARQAPPLRSHQRPNQVYK